VTRYKSRRDMLRDGAVGALAVLSGVGGGGAQVPSATAPEHRHGLIKQSVSRWCYKDVPLDKLCAYSAQIGLKGVDLLEAADFEVPGRYGLVCTMGYAGGGEIKKGLNRVENHAEIEAGLRKYVPLAAKAGVPNVITFSGQRDGLSDEEGARNTVIGLKRVRSIIEDNGVNLCIELLNSKVNHHGYMFDHTSWGVGVLEEVGSPRMKILYDIYHAQIMEGDLIATIQANSKWMGHYHTGGVPGRHELDDTQEVNWRGVMSAIAATGFNGYVAHEFVPKRDPLTSLREAVVLCDV
jgi:hydroxypyruvate isomerase